MDQVEGFQAFLRFQPKKEAEVADAKAKVGKTRMAPKLSESSGSNEEA